MALSRCGKCIVKLIILVIILIGFAIAIVFIGAKIEMRRAVHTEFVANPLMSRRVCAFQYDNSTTNATSRYTTYNNATMALLNGAIVSHCGDCGACSHLQDYQVYVEESQTFYYTLRSCLLNSIIGTDLKRCLEKTLNFTSSCNDCQLSFLTCNRKKCGFSWAAANILRTSSIPNANKNDFLLCAEKRCGTEFLACAGASLARLNITSDIDLPSSRMCNVTQVDWSKYNFDTNPVKFK